MRLKVCALLVDRSVTALALGSGKAPYKGRVSSFRGCVHRMNGFPWVSWIFMRPLTLVRLGSAGPVKLTIIRSCTRRSCVPAFDGCLFSIHKLPKKTSILKQQRISAGIDPFTGACKSATKHFTWLPLKSVTEHFEFSLENLRIC